VLRYDPMHQTYRVRGIIPAYLLNGGSYYVDPVAAIHRKETLISDVRGVAMDVTFDVPNPDYVIKKGRRQGAVAPILEWHPHEVREADSLLGRS
jgi:hypothetical protein